MEVGNAGMLPLTGPDGGEPLQSGRDVGVEGTASWEERERETEGGEDRGGKGRVNRAHISSHHRATLVTHQLPPVS